MNDEARQRALKILERRDVSRKMLLDKLTEKGISNADAEEVADWLCGLGVVNDERFAGLVVRHYAAKGYGKRRICDELYRRGIDRELWDAALDENLAPRMRVWLVEADSSRKGESSSILRKSSRERVSRILQADSSARSLVLSLYGTREKFRRPDVTIYDLKVSYTPETAEAVDSLYIDQLGLKIFADEFFSVFSPDSLQLPLHGEASR